MVQSVEIGWLFAVISEELIINAKCSNFVVNFAVDFIKSMIEPICSSRVNGVVMLSVIFSSVLRLTHMYIWI